MKIKYFSLIFLLLILFLFYGCGEKRVEDIKEVSSEAPIDNEVSDVESEISNIENMELDQIDVDLEYLEDI